jgi:hypothetical protein
MIRIRNLAVVCLAAFLCVVTARAQISGSTGAIQGTVDDASGAIVPGATVKLTNTSTGVVAGTVTTRNNGAFVFPLLTPGTYQLEVTAQGFNASRIEGIAVEVTKVDALKAVLTVGQVSSEVTVNASAQMVDTVTSTTGDVEGGLQIKATPLPTRNFLNLTSLQAGVASTMQSAAVVGSGTPVLEVAGQRSINNNFVLDGVDANNVGGFSLGNAPVPNPDAVEEFRVSTSMYDASSGHSSGGNINAVIRSGTDHFHGNLFYFNRNTDYNANDFFFNQKGAPRPTLLQNQYGGTIGGPIPKLHDTFWFFSFQGTKQINGVASAVAGSQPVLPTRSASTTQAAYIQALATAFGIPAGNIDPVAANILLAPGQYGGYLFASGSCSSCAAGASGSVAIAIPTRYAANQYVGSLDRQITKNNRLSAKYFENISTELTPTGGTTLGQGQNTPANNYHFALSDSQTFTSNLVNQFDGGFTKLRNGTFPIIGVTVQQIGETKWDSAFGDSIPNFTFPTGANAQSFGGANTNGSVHGGSASITFNDTVSWTLGNHTIRTGGQFIRYQWNYENDYGATGAIGFPNFDSFLTGSPNSIFVSTGLHYNEFRDYNLSGFIQDDYRATKRLTLNLGVRYDFIGWPHDDLNRIGNYDLSLVAPGCVAGGGGACMEKGFIAPAGAASVGTPGVSGTTLLSTNHPIWAPRVGFAYDVFGNSKLAIHGGFGIFNITDSNIPILQLNAGPPVLDLYNTSVTGLSDQLANPWPAGLLLPSAFPAIPPMGQFQGTFNANGTPQFLDPNGNSIPLVGNYSMNRQLIHSYNEQWSLNAELSPFANWVLQVGYVGSHNLHLLTENAINIAALASPTHPVNYTYTPPGGGTPVTTSITTNSAANANLRVPEIGISAGGNTQIGNLGFSYYDALTVEVRHAFAHGVRANVDYTWGKSIDDVSAIGGLAVNRVIPALNRAVSDFNEPQRLVFVYTWDIPGPRSGWMKQVLGGWESSGVYTLQSGLPFSVTSTSGGSLFGTSGFGMANRVAGCGPLQNPGATATKLNNYINTACFQAVPTLAAGTVVSGINAYQGPGTDSFTVGGTGPGDPGTGSLLGNSERNIIQGPLDQDFDMSLLKNFGLKVLGRQPVLQFRVEAFKLFNNVNFSNPNVSINSTSTFGKITSTLDNTGRILQLAAKLSF